MSDLILAAKVASLGDDTTTATDRRWRWATGVPTGGTASWRSLYLNQMTDKFPSEIATSIDFRAGTTSIGTLPILLQAVDAVTQRFYRNVVDRIGYLRASVAAGAGTIIVEDKAGNGVTGIAVGTTLALEREVLRVTVDNTGGSYDVARGRLGTVDAAHVGRANDRAADSEIFYAESGHLLEDRELVLVRVPVDGSETDEEVMYRGVISGISNPGGIRLETRTVIELLQRRKICANLWRRRINRGAGAFFAQATYSPGGPAHLGVNANSDTASPISVGGKTAVVNATAYGSRISADLGSPYTSRFGSSPLPTEDDLDGDAWEFFSLHPDAPSLDAAGNVRLGREGNAASGDPVSNPFTLLLQMLLTSPTGDNHATYDLGTTASPRIADNIGLAIPSSLIDIDAIETIRAANPAIQESLHMGFDGEPIDDVLAWIQQRLLRPYGCVLTVGDEYKLTVVQLTATIRSNTPAIVEADFVGIPTSDRQMGGAFDSVSVKFNDVPGAGTTTSNFTDAYNRQRLISGRHKEADLDAHGIADPDLVTSVVLGLAQRYHHPLPQIQFTLLNTQSHWPGQLLSITHSKLYGTDGTRGNTTQAYVIVARRGSLKDANISYKAVYTGAIFGRLRLLSGSLEIATSPGAGVYTVTRNEFTSGAGPDDAIQDDVDAFVATDIIQSVTRAGATHRAGTGTIGSIDSATQITLSSDFGTPAAVGTIFIPADYDDVTAAQQALWTHIASAGDTLGSALDDAYEWVV